MKKIFVVLASLFVISFSLRAQETFYPGWYLGVQGGLNYTSSNEWGISHWKHFNPNASLNLGYDFTPVFGLRGSLSGPRANFPVEKTNNKFLYGQLGLDATVDICNIFNYNPSRLLSPYVFLGGAAYGRQKVNDVAAHLGVGVRGGAGLNVRLSDLVSFNIELLDNMLGNKFNTKDDNAIFAGGVLNWKRPFKWDDNFAALAGLKFNIGANNKRKAAVAAAAAAAAEAAALEAARAAEKAAAERAAAEKAAAEKLAAEKAAAEKAAAEKAAADKAAAEAAALRAQARASQENVYFDLNKSVIRKAEAPKIDNIVALMKEYPEAVVTITGYADKQTGTHKRNMTLSQERAERVAKALKDAGIDAGRITVKYVGDTEQVSNVREENRVAVCVTR
ncbi:MAG: OmpA family protein [Bacteroidales bacterium]|nr:OmpA family protein [Bacteroidales bacterium]